MGRTVDLSILKEMVGDDPEIIQEMLEIFCQDVPQYMDAIQQGELANDWAAIANAAHTLKSTVGFTGRKDLVQLAEKLQYQKTVPEDPVYFDLLKQFKTEILSVLQEVKEMVDNKEF